MSAGLGLWPGYSWDVAIASTATLTVTVDAGSPTPVSLSDGSYRGLAPSGSLLHLLQDSINAVFPLALGAPVVTDGDRYPVASWALGLSVQSITIADGTVPSALFGIVSGTTFSDTDVPPAVVTAGPWAGLWSVNASTSIRFDERRSHSQTRSAYVGQARTAVTRGSVRIAEDEHLLIPGRQIDRRYTDISPAYAVQAGVHPSLVYGTLAELLEAWATGAPREYRPGDTGPWPLYRHTSVSDLLGTKIDLDVPGDVRLSDLATAEGGGRRYRVRVPWVEA